MADGNYALKLEQYNLTHKVGLTSLSGQDLTFNYTVPTNTWTHLAFVGHQHGSDPLRERSFPGHHRHN